MLIEGLYKKLTVSWDSFANVFREMLPKWPFRNKLSLDDSSMKSATHSFATIAF